MHEAELVIEDLTLPEVEERWGISRNAVKSRAKALGVQLIRKSSTCTVWPGDQLEKGDALHHHLQMGGTMKDFAGSATTGSSDGMTPQASPAQESAPSSAITPSGDSSQMMALAAALAQALPQHPQAPQPRVSPLTRARELAAIEREELLLTADEMSEVLGMGVDKDLDGQERFGYVFKRFPTVGQTKWVWTCRRADGSGRTAIGGSTSAHAISGSTDMGFAASNSMINVTPGVELPGFFR